MAANDVFQSVNYTMGTVMMNRASGKYAEEALRAVDIEAVRLEKLLSRFMCRSDISMINKSAGIKCERLSDDTYTVLTRAIEFSICCQGFFDVTIGPLVDLWSNGKNASRPPDEAGIMKILPLVNYNDLILEPSGISGLKRAGQSIDLGGIGKGFAGDKFLEVFKKYDILSAFSNIGGNVAALGARPDGYPWCVGIQHPRQENSLIGFVSVVGKAVVTSGDYQRYFIDSNGKRHHHILDPSTGYPVKSGLISVTIVADRSMDADALSTVLFIAGKEKGLKLLKRFSGAEAILVDINLQVHITAGLKECFQASEGISVHILN